MRRIAGLLIVVAGCKSPPATAPEPEPGPPPATEEAAPAEDPFGAPEPPSLSGAFLDAHNVLRAKHCAPALSWSEELEQVARAWATQLKAKGCGFEHSSTKYGENLAANTEGALTPESVTAMWYAELSKYDFKHAGFSMATGHFTQLVWANTRSLGCATVNCNGMDLWVCNYDPPGNVQGGYANNVKPTTCK